MGWMQSGERRRRGRHAEEREGGGGLREHKVDVLTCGSKHVTAPNGEDPKKESVGELGGVQGGSYRPEIPLIFGCHFEEEITPSLVTLQALCCESPTLRSPPTERLFQDFDDSD